MRLVVLPHLKQKVRSQLLVLFARDERLDHSRPRKSQLFQPSDRFSVGGREVHRNTSLRHAARSAAGARGAAHGRGEAGHPIVVFSFHVLRRRQRISVLIVLFFFFLEFTIS